MDLYFSRINMKAQIRPLGAGYRNHSLSECAC
jgi:hypothetical protein